MIEQDSARLLQSLTNEIVRFDATHIHAVPHFPSQDGNDLCHMFGLCPKSTPLMDSFNLKDVRSLPFISDHSLRDSTLLVGSSEMPTLYERLRSPQTHRRTTRRMSPLAIHRCHFKHMIYF